MPQGDPLGHVVMMLWTWAGWATVEQACSRAQSLSRIYVDDGAFSSNRVWYLTERFCAWTAWSRSVGLAENTSKAWACASTPFRRGTLRRTLPEHVALDLELLGACTMVSRRKLLPKEEQRVTACKRTCVLLSCVGFPFNRFMSAVRAFAVSKLAYG